jgi:hypothetical protein
MGRESLAESKRAKWKFARMLSQSAVPVGISSSLQLILFPEIVGCNSG